MEAEDQFKWQDGQLYCEDMCVREIQDSLTDILTTPSPFYLHSKRQLVKNISDYQMALKKHQVPYIMGYAVKANYSPALLQLISSMGCAAVTVSGLETKLAIQTGFTPENIIYNGNGKQHWEIELAISNGCMMNVDSEFDLQHVIQVAKKLQKKTRILLRMNPDIDSQVHPFLATGLGASKFGISEQELPDVLSILKVEPLVQLVGLHSHLGSTISNVNVFRESVEVMLEMIKKVRAQGFSDIQYINMGGGLGVDYTRHVHKTEKQGSETNGRTPAPTAFDLIEAIHDKLEKTNLTLILEPGRSIIGNATILVCRVVGTKQNGNTRYIVCDGSMNEVIRPSFYSAYHHIALIEPSKHASQEIKEYDVVGPVCECADFIGKERRLPEPHEGCGLAVFDVGAYCGSMASNYNLRVRPAEVLVDGNTWRVVRKPDTLEQILLGYNV